MMELSACASWEVMNMEDWNVAIAYNYVDEHNFAKHATSVSILPPAVIPTHSHISLPTFSHLHA